MTVETTVTSRPSLNSESDSLQTKHREKNPRTGPAQLAPDSSYDTALPQLPLKRLSVSHPARESESSTRGHNSRGIQRLAPFHNQDTTVAGNHAHRRTGSTLKTVMRRIFTRKRRSETDEVDDTAHDFHIGNQGPGEHSLAVPKSTSSRHSSPRKDNASPPMDAVPERLEPTRRARRATLPSLVLSEGESREALGGALYPEKGVREWAIGYRSNHSQDSLRRSHLLASKRRSLSTNALRGAADGQASLIQRRRSTEACGHSTQLAAVSDSEVSFRPTSSSTATGILEESTASTSDADQESLAPNVGHLVNSMQNNENASLEQRLTTLEVKLIDLEFALARMQRGASSPGDKPRHHKKPPKSDAGRKKHVRKHSSGYFPPVDTTATTSSSPPQHEEPPESDRPLSTSTVRPNGQHRAPTLQTPSTSSQANYSGIAVEQYSALVMLLRREQSARRSLESQVSSLADDMHQLQRVARDPMGMGMGVGVGTMYPILSKDSQEFLGRDRSVSTSPRGDGLAASPYDSDSDWDRPDPYPQHDFGRGKWERSPRIEIAGMI
ncbi:hypothetical protein PHISP_04636 [Aspergillus sp. HF37]|nr:hypothetical protein PHISP_04636 [Aspergillus sp. HF37]